LADRFTENRYQQRATIVLLDGAEAADPRVMDQVVRLIHLDVTTQPWLTIVLAMASDRIDIVPEHLLNLVELRIELGAWQPEDTAAFLAEVNSRGVYHGALLGPDAARKIHDLAEGIPRRINQLVEMTMIATAGGGNENVDRETIDRVHDELVTVQNAW
jgi:general secretion pathway protein A